MSDINITPTEEKAVAEFKKRLSEREGLGLVDVYLFGSKARGDAGEYSDIDILVILEDPDEEKIGYIYDSAIEATGEEDIYLSVKIFSRKEFEYYKSIPTVFIKNILQEGESI
jgi:predicted nucleotidyltransferase